MTLEEVEALPAGSVVLLRVEWGKTYAAQRGDTGRWQSTSPSAWSYAETGTLYAVATDIELLWKPNG